MKVRWKQTPLPPCPLLLLLVWCSWCLFLGSLRHDFMRIMLECFFLFRRRCPKYFPKGKKTKRKRKRKNNKWFVFNQLFCYISCTTVYTDVCHYFSFSFFFFSALHVANALCLHSCWRICSLTQACSPLAEFFRLSFQIPFPTQQRCSMRKRKEHISKTNTLLAVLFLLLFCFFFCFWLSCFDPPCH